MDIRVDRSALVLADLADLDRSTSELGRAVSGNASNRTRVIGLFRDLAASGAAVLLASDDPAILAAADRTVMLDRSGGPTP